MDVSLGSFVGGSLGVAAVVLAACGLFLIFLDINSGLEEPGPLRRRLGQAWLCLVKARLLEAPALAVRAAIGAVDRFVVYWFEQSEKNVASGGAFTLIVLVAIPLVALLNWLRGGSGFLTLVILVCIAGFAVLAILSEMNRGARLAAVLSALLFAAIFVFVPGYVFVSLTDRALHMPIGHAALISLLVAPLLYFVCHSVVLIGAAAWGMPVPSAQATSARRIATLFAAALPFAYLAVFACLLLGHVAVPEANVPAAWPPLLLAMGLGALSAAVTAHLARDRSPLRGLGAASLLAVALAAVVALGASNWLLAVPLAAAAILWALAALALLARTVLAWLRPWVGAGGVAERPYMVAGSLVLIVAAGAGWASAAL